uniref:Putative hhh secreted protein n=1 Tax=Psorophora albipes TaxID=869069 RepID=T1D5H6_9DIPT
MKFLLVTLVVTILAVVAFAFPQDHRDDADADTDTEASTPPPSDQWNGTDDNIAEQLFNLTFPNGEIPIDFDPIWRNGSEPIQPRPFRVRWGDVLRVAGTVASWFG